MMDEMVDLCRRCHRLASFTNYNGNTFSAIARAVIGGLEIPNDTAALARSLAGHIVAGMRVKLRSNGPRAEHKEGRYSDSPSPWRVHGKRFAITHWLFRGQRRSGVRRSMNLPLT
jgi:hypothetical protein